MDKYWKTDILSGRYRPLHPGEILELEFVKATRPPPILNTELFELAHCQRDVTPDLAKQLSELFGTTLQFWLNLQSHYDKEMAELERE